MIYYVNHVPLRSMETEQNEFAVQSSTMRKNCKGQEMDCSGLHMVFTMKCWIRS